MSLDLLAQKIAEKQNPTVAGLDPDMSFIPEYIKKEAFLKSSGSDSGAAAAVLSFNMGLIDSLCDVVPAVKVQCAYYEQYGWQGMRALTETMSYAKEKGLFVIADGKRGDIGATAGAYARAFLSGTGTDGECRPPFPADALTVNGYLGTDGIAPFIDACASSDKGIFVLVKTSNPSSYEIQDRKAGDTAVYEHMGLACERLGRGLPGKYGYSGVGAVVGATYPEQLAHLRKLLPHTFFLIPGYGAQGGKARDAALGFDEKGGGAVVNSSRAIMCAYRNEGCGEEYYAQAARREALRMRDLLMEEIGGISL